MLGFLYWWLRDGRVCEGESRNLYHPPIFLFIPMYWCLLGRITGLAGTSHHYPAVLFLLLLWFIFAFRLIRNSPGETCEGTIRVTWTLVYLCAGNRVTGGRTGMQMTLYGLWDNLG